MRNKEQEEEVLECNFFPKVNKNFIKTDLRKTEYVVQDSESYNIFLTRNQKIRDDKLEEIKKINSKPGSGNIWTKKLTVPLNTRLQTNKIHNRPNSSNVLTKSYSISKFKSVDKSLTYYSTNKSLNVYLCFK